ncbi:putative immunity protein [Dyadobacter sp. SG02]|uniref:putative immunity protein n=1 Tax=Dyadobacter sp. SG02 TaxID=1855291 RepID=UPI001C431532|nr:hypothetical protein [Dyadobacter sp. SG02]
MQQHRDLLQWASGCVKHSLALNGEQSNPSLLEILGTGNAWAQGKVSVGEVRKAAFAAIAIAKQLDDPAKIALTRASGHAVAVAHMADHALKAADYALKALPEHERVMEQQWQNEQLPDSIASLVLSARK